MAEVVEFSVMSAIPNPFAGPENVTDFAVPEKPRLADVQLQ